MDEVVCQGLGGRKVLDVDVGMRGSDPAVVRPEKWTANLKAFSEIFHCIMGNGYLPITTWIGESVK